MNHLWHYDQCQSCGLVFVNPRPTPASLGKFYESYSQSMEGVSDSQRHKPVASNANRRLIREMLTVRSGPGRFLDVGSGLGGGSAAAVELGFTVTALEADIAHLNAVAQLPGVQTVHGLFETFNPEPASFDYILMSHVLEHAHDPKAWITKAYQLLSPGGTLWVLLPNFNSIYRRLWDTGDPYFIPPTHLNHFNPKSLPSLCKGAGLKVVLSRDEFALPRDVLSKRFNKALAPAIELLTSGIEACGKIGTRLIRSGPFLTVACVKN